MSLQPMGLREDSVSESDEELGRHISFSEALQALTLLDNSEQQQDTLKILSTLHRMSVQITQQDLLGKGNSTEDWLQRLFSQRQEEPEALIDQGVRS